MAQHVEVAPQVGNADPLGPISQITPLEHGNHLHQAGVGRIDELGRIDQYGGVGEIGERGEIGEGGARQSASMVLGVPAHKDFVVIIRSAVAQLGACFGFTVQEITDLRLAVNEACGLLVAGSTGDRSTAGPLECRAEVRGDALRVLVSAPAGGFDAPNVDGLGWNLMAALVDTLTWAQDGVTARVDLAKRRGVDRDAV